MAKKNKYKVKIEEQQRLTPNKFQQMQNQINNAQNKSKKKLDDVENLAYQAEDIDNDDLEQDENIDNENETSEDPKKDENEEDEENKNDEENENDDNDEEDSDDEKDDKNSENHNNLDLSNRNNLNPNRNESVNNDDNADKTNEDNEIDNDLGSSAALNMISKNEAVEKTIKTANDLQNAAIKTKSTLVFIGQLLINPIFWIIVALFFVGIYISSAILIVGQNDYNVLCDDMGVGSLMLDPNADDFTRQAAIASWFTSTPFEIMGGQPLTREQAIGIMGNLMQESYGANPRAIQNDHSITKWQTCDNQCVLSWGNAGGKAIGIIQWDTGRRQELVKFAISEGTQWHDLNTQLKFLKNEMDSGYERDQLIRGGFHEPTKGIADYVRIWNQYFERSAEAFGNGNNIRVTYANDFAAKYTGSGSSVAGGLANYCIGGMQGVDTSNLVQLAIASAWPDKADSRGTCVGYVNCGQNFAMAAYKETKLLAEQNSTKDPISGLLASCDRYVATMYRATGKDINFPWGGANIQGAYMKSSPKWVEISCQDRQPGDVLWRNGHVMLYLGMVNGKDSIGSASLPTRTGAISGVSCSGNQFIADGDTATGFRMVNN